MIILCQLLFFLQNAPKTQIVRGMHREPGPCHPW
jgi:hypothetical protein